VHADAVEHQRVGGQHLVPAVPDYDGAVLEHVGHGNETGRGHPVGKGGVLKLVVRVPRSGSRSTR